MTADRPAFMRVKTTQLTHIVQRGSPRFCEGRWLTPELSLVAAAVSLWFVDLVQEGRRQFTDVGHLWLSGSARSLLDVERGNVELMAGALGIEPVWLDRILRALDLDFTATGVRAQ